MEKNDVSSFFYYMWNRWDEEECKIAFRQANCGWAHLWSKYCQYYSEYGVNGAISMFYANLNEDNQDLLVKRATTVYNKKHRLI